MPETMPSNPIGLHLSELRRYAAALTGAIASGDAYVVACLEAILEAPDLIDRPHLADEKVPLRLAIFRAFAAIWSSTNTDRDYVTSVPGYKPLFSMLQMLDPTSRQAVLLTALMGFSYEETAVILKHAPMDIRDICLSASDFLQGQTDDDDAPLDEDEDDEDDAISEPFFPPADAYFKGSLAWRWVQAQRTSK